MDRNKLVEVLRASKIFQQWHWFSRHFDPSLRGLPNLLADSIIDACLVCENRIPGYAERTINSIANIGGREKHHPDLEQLLQVLAELLVVSHVLQLNWDEATAFEAEPSNQKGGKNPEIIVRNPKITLGVEVKAPALFSHQARRAANSEQIASRFATRDKIHGLLKNPDKTTYPRDNPVKDFLVSAQSKFEQFKSEPNFVSVLVIVWDDFIFEPISALLEPSSGLLTKNSFFKDSIGRPVIFKSIGAVIIIRQLHQIVRAYHGKSLAHPLNHPLQYDIGAGFPPKALVNNPFSEQPKDGIGDIFLAVPPGPELGAEYTPKELIWWF